MKKLVKNDKIVKPVFIVGTARSGTQEIYKLFSKHRDLCYFEHYVSKFWMKPFMFKLLPIFLKYQRSRYGIRRPRATQGIVWDRFDSPINYVDEKNATKEVTNYYYSAIEAELKAFKAKRFVGKHTRLCTSIKWVNAMFPDAFYVVVWRDPKDTVNLIHRQLEKWRDLPPQHAYTHNYKGHHSILEKFGENTTHRMEAYIKFFNYQKDCMQNDLHVIKNKMIEIKFEDFQDSPKKTIKELYEFTELDWYKKLERIIPEKIEVKTNNTWKDLLPEEKTILEKVFP